MRTPGEALQLATPHTAFDVPAATEPLPVALVVFTSFQPGARWNPQPVSPGMAVLEMLRHTIPVQRTPARVLATLTSMLHSATAWTTPREEADATAAALLAWLQSLPERG